MSDSLIIPKGSVERFLFFRPPAPNEQYTFQSLVGGISDLMPGYLVRRHRFYAHELLMPLAGALRIRLNNIDSSLVPGEIVFLPQSIEHFYWSEKKLKFLWFHLRPDLLPVESTPSCFRRCPRFFDELRLLSELLYLEEKRHPEHCTATANSLRYYLETEICATAPQHRHFQQINRVFEQVRRNLCHHWSVPEMARLACLSESHFYSTVKEIYLVTPLEVLRQMRMETGAALLLRGDDGLTMIAEQTGYADALSFSKAFKKYYHCSPREFRTR